MLILLEKIITTVIIFKFLKQCNLNVLSTITIILLNKLMNKNYYKSYASVNVIYFSIKYKQC